MDFSREPSANRTRHPALRDHAGIVSDVLFMSIGEGAIIIDERGTIARINRIALGILGYKENELIGKWFPQVIVAEDENGKVIPNIERPVTEAFLTGRPVFKRVFYRCKDGTSVPMALTVSPIMLQGKPLGAIEVFRDITDELRLEQAKDEFISIASHQLRTPATVVKQYLGMVLDGYAESDAQRTDMLRIAYANNNTQLDIINDLLKVAQIEANRVAIDHQETDLAALLEDIVNQQRLEYNARAIGLNFVSKTSSATVCIDPLHIQMVLENLINNANKYSHAGSTVTVELTGSAKAVTVHIKDQGIGIASHDLPKLFHKFSRVKNPHSTAGGTGLGLYWARKLIELHHGNISVSSQLHKGTTFSVSIPRLPASAG